MHVHDLRSGSCLSCNHNEIIEASPVTFNDTAKNADGNPLGLAHATYRSMGFLCMKQENPFGRLFTYTCRRCGLTQWVAAKPEDVPIGPEHGTRIITGAPAQPFR